MLNTRTITELKELCDAFDIQYTKNARKQDVISVIEEAGFTWSDYENSSTPLSTLTVEEKKEVKVLKEEKEEDKIWLTMVHKRGALQIGDLHFDMEEPFLLVGKTLAEKVLKEEPDEVREATPAEAYAFENGE